MSHRELGVTTCL